MHTLIDEASPIITFGSTDFPFDDVSIGTDFLSTNDLITPLPVLFAA